VGRADPLGDLDRLLQVRHHVEALLSSSTPTPFILLTLALSLQASYAAPLILLAQNRQAERDRQETEADRRTSARTQADTEYLAGELAGIRLALGEMPTREYLGEELEDLRAEVQRLRAQLEPGAEA
jgi:uncharacterized membrane protein